MKRTQQHEFKSENKCRHDSYVVTSLLVWFRRTGNENFKRPSGAGGADQDNIKELSLLAEEGGTSMPIICWSGQPGAHHICPQTSRTRGVLRGCSSSRQDWRRTTTGPERISLD